MSDAEKTESTLMVDQLIESFNWLLSPRYQEILNSFNQALMRLYANIGKTCIAYLRTKDVKTEDEGLQEISNELVERYGEIFNVSQLKLMMLLAPHHDLPDRRASLLYALNWEMTSLLLPITDANEKEFTCVLLWPRIGRCPT
jgi:hypothetical protein